MFRRALAALSSAAVLASALVLASPAVATGPGVGSMARSASADPAPVFADGITRLAGQTQYDTAIRVSQKYAPGVRALFVATGQDFPDALSAAAAAAYLGGPLLLTPSTALPAAVLDEVRRLRPERIYIAGGTAAVSSSIESTLRSVATTQRLGGSNRYDTANRIVAAVFPEATQAFIATGRTFPDALAATGAAGSLAAPVILVDGTRSALATETLSLLSRLGVSSVAIAGGPGAVSTGIQSQLSQKATTVRHGGASRYETASSINDEYFPAAPAAFVATGSDFPDALAGAALAGRMNSPVYITTKTCLPDSARRSLLTLGARSTVVLGSANVVSGDAADGLGCLTVGRPAISGSPVANAQLTAQPGTWTAGTTFRYQWLAAGAAISGATSASLIVTSAMVGKTISVRVTGVQGGYLSTSAVSAGTAKAAYPPRTAPIAGTWACPAWAPIKGNAESMIYHVPGAAFYDRTNPEECFRYEADARLAGYRRAQV